jgi:hypothetical protein
MTAVTIKAIESLPDEYPAVDGSPSILSAAAAAIDPAIIWQRIESYVAYRWSSRALTWIVEGPGEWAPPLAPSIIHTKTVWCGDAWQTADLSPAPCGGFVLPGSGPYRFTSTVGSGAELPEAVIEAFRRLAEYFASKVGDTDPAGARSVRVSIGGEIEAGHSRDQAWTALALQNSGAGDLLRPYRRAA